MHARMKLRLLLLAAFLACATALHAQFYAPDTEFHDLAQRTFPVEAARVLAWLQNATGAQIAEITYAVETTPERVTVWQIHWRDGAGKSLRSRELRYAESLLAEGAPWFRSLFQQLCRDGWALSSASSDNSAAAFWQGAELAGVSRAEALTAATRLLSEKPRVEKAADAARLAGILAHGALPTLSSQVTLDSVLLSRAAAWLCVSEARLRENLDPAWAPILFLSGREKLAESLWSTAVARPGARRGPALRFWDLMLRKPTAKDAFVFAASSENRQFAMSALMVFGFLNTFYLPPICHSAPLIFGPGGLVRLHDYWPYLAGLGGQSGAALLDGPGESRRAWLNALSVHEPSALDRADFRGELSKAKEAVAKSVATDPLAAWEEAAPLLNAGLEQRGVRLIPVAHATTQDLLGFGWEMTGLQLAAAHFSAPSPSPRGEQAREILGRKMALVRGLEPFFGPDESGASALLKKPGPPATDVRRLQFQSQYYVCQALAATWVEPKHRGTTYLRRCWLSRSYWPLRALSRGELPAEELIELLTRCRREGGQVVGGNLLEVLDPREKQNKFALHPAAQRLRIQLTAEVPTAFGSKVYRAWEETKDREEATYRYAQAVEKIGWDALLPLYPDRVFKGYLRARGLTAARDYYRDLRRFIPSPADLSQKLGPMRWALAWLEGDEGTMAQVLAEVASFTLADLTLRALHAIAHQDFAAAEAALTDAIERYPDYTKEEAELRRFLPLIPALKDRTHPQREEALTYFTVRPQWLTVQWMLIEQSALTVEEAVCFLGGDKADPLRQVAIASLRADKSALNRAWEAAEAQIDALSDTTFVLLQHLRAQLMRYATPVAQAGLMPHDAKPLTQLVAEAMAGAGADEGADASDLARFKTADELWKHLEMVRTTALQGSREEVLRKVRTWLETAEAFVKRHPQDPRRWDAKLIAVTIRGQLAQLSGRSDEGAVPARKEIESVLNAADASAEAKGEAAFLLLMLEARSVNRGAPHTLPPFHRAAAEYLQAHPSHARAVEVAGMQLQLIETTNAPGAENILKQLAVHPNEAISAQAKAAIALREKLAALKSKPVELKFTALDGAEIDLGKLRGKVVLIDFWASWCGPCIAEMPNVVRTYEKLRERGFVVLGISLDQDKAAMEKTMQKLGMTWPQHFDGKGWENEISSAFGIRSIPTTWLIDKKGMLREGSVRGEALEPAVEKLLAE